MNVEYRVKRVTRYIVTRHHQTEGGATGGTTERGQYDNEEVAFEVANALARQEHETLGYPPGDERIVYPRRFEDASNADYALSDPRSQLMNADLARPRL